MEPLTNCMSLVHMLSSRIHGSRKLFWKNVRMECERLHAEHLRLNKWELLAAMQALSIYILMRLDEGETDHNNLDALMVTTVIMVATQFNSIGIDTTSVTHLMRGDTSWKDWIFEESARRLCIVYQVVDMLVYFEPAALMRSASHRFATRTTAGERNSYGKQVTSLFGKHNLGRPPVGFKRLMDWLRMVIWSEWMKGGYSVSMRRCRILSLQMKGLP